MTNDDSLVREVNESLAEDQLWSSIKRRLPFLLAGAAVIVAGVAGWQIQDNRKSTAAASAAEAYRLIMVETAQGNEDAEARLRAFADSAPAGYAVIARFQLAALAARRGAGEEARAQYRAIFDDRNAPKRLRDLARIKSAHIALGISREAVITDAGALETDGSAFGFFAREALALAALTAGDFETALTMFRSAAASLEAPDPVKARAVEFAALAAAGKSGVPVTPPAPSQAGMFENILESIDAESGALGELLRDAAAARAADNTNRDEDASQSEDAPDAGSVEPKKD